MVYWLLLNEHLGKQCTPWLNVIFLLGLHCLLRQNDFQRNKYNIIVTRDPSIYTIVYRFKHDNLITRTLRTHTSTRVLSYMGHKKK